MIEAIRLGDCQPYRGALIEGCKKVNFIFGPNGSGKSTISSLLSGAQDPRFASCNVLWDGLTHEDVCVYDRAFRSANFQETIPGVFTMGSASIEEMEELDRLKRVLSDVEDDLNKKDATLAKLVESRNDRERRFRDDVWTQVLKRTDDRLQAAFEGLRRSKDKFVSELKRRRAGIPGHEGRECDRQDLLARAEVLYDSNPAPFQRCDPPIDEALSRIEAVREDPVWGTAVVGSEDVDIAALIESLGNGAWVEQGRRYLVPGSKVCPFCQQETITEELVGKLEAFFGGEYQRQVSQMGRLRRDFVAATEGVLTALEDCSRIEGMAEVGRLNVEAYRAKVGLLRAEYAEHAKLMDGKLAEPGARVAIPDATPLLAEVLDLLEGANSLIDAHNAMVRDHAAQRVALTDDVWATCLAENDALVRSYQKDMRNAAKGIEGVTTKRDEASRRVGELRSEVEERGRHVTSVQPAIDEINRSLKAYGFTGFSISPAEGRKNHYCILRDDGTSAMHSLSEGEETFLTFLYFMETTKGSADQSRVAGRRVVVLDDPISSLDSTVLYVVSAMVKDLANKVRRGEGDVSQLFVLTHNVFFHKEASFVDGRTQEIKDVNYWMVRKRDGVSSIQAYGMENPISTTYELLWRELRENSGASLVSTQNIMRRIIENYFGMLGRRRDERLVEGFDSVEERMVADSLLYWINDGSHSIPDDLFIDSYTDSIPRYKHVFREIFERSGHIEHYNMMMGIEGEPADSSERAADGTQEGVRGS